MHPLRAAGLVGLAPLGALIMGALAWITPFLIRYILIGLGVGLVTFVGASAALDTLEAHMASQFSGLPANIAAMLSLARVDDAVSLVVSAWAGRIAVQAAVSSSKLIFGRGAQST